MSARTPVVPDKTVYRWDLDKTYLRTEFDRMRDLVRTAFETSAQKRSVPGAAALLRELGATRPAGVYILSGSPEQMRRVLESKLRQDGLVWNGFALKPSLENLLRGRFRFLRDQLGYKLGVLLRSRPELDTSFDEILFGDDAEADAYIYSLYADICAGVVDADLLAQVLDLARVYPDERAALLDAHSRMPDRDCVQQIFIHLDRVSSPDAFSPFGPRVCPIYNYFQTAVVLVELGAIDADAAIRVGAENVLGNGFNPEALLASFTDVAKRGFVGKRVASALLTATEKLEDRESASGRVLVAFAEQLGRIIETFGEPRAREPVEIDYVALFAGDRIRADEARQRAVWRRSSR